MRGVLEHLRVHRFAGVLAGVLVVLCLLELSYLAVGNAIVRSSLIKRAVASADGFKLDYGSAYTLWPGHVRLRDFSLRVEDYNIQFEVALADASLDIDLSRLPFKKFRVTRLDADGVRFRARHKLITVGDDAERVAAYPPIRGFADPPYYRGVRPPPIPDSEYDLWEVQIENVTGRLRELWMLEYRLRGEGLVRGSFVIRPARWVQVQPAHLEIVSGKLTLGEHLVASRVHGRISCDIPDMRVQESEGRQVFKDISAGIDLRLDEGRLDFLSAYLGRLGSARYAGVGAWLFDVDMKRGVIQPGSRMMLRAEPFELHHELGDLQGKLSVNLGRDPRLAPDRLQLAWSIPELEASRAGAARGPRLEGVAGGLELYATDLSGALSLGAGQVAVRRASIPDLGWFVVPGASLSGSGSADLSLERHADGGLAGQTHWELMRAGLALGNFSARADVSGDLAFKGAPDDLRAERLQLALTRTELRSGQDRTDPFSARLDGSGLRLRPSGELEAQGQLRLHVSSSEALLPLVMANPWRGMSSTALDLQALDARAQLRMHGKSLELRRIDAQSGKLRLQGYLSKRSRQPRGALLFSSSLINVGVELRDGDTEVSPFVGDDWLAAQMP
jgi:hypothetical protein